MNFEHAMIIGAMKSGTSSFYHYLIQHPQICPAKMKEPMFFTDHQSQKVQIDNYLDLWDFDSKRHKIALEGSTGYTKYPFEPNVPRKIYEYGIKPKMIYCVRNPVDRISSQYEYAKGKNWPNQDELSDLIPLSNYYLQLQRFREFFLKENFLIVDFDDISTDAQKAANKAFDFLNVHHYVVDTKRIYNKRGVTDESGKDISSGNGNVNKREFTALEKEQIFMALKSDMKLFQQEYNFDTSKWGF
jgi:hypothetical protein